MAAMTAQRTVVVGRWAAAAMATAVARVASAAVGDLQVAAAVLRASEVAD